MENGISKHLPGEESPEMREGFVERINDAMIDHAGEIAKEIGATAVLLYIDIIKSPK